MKKERAKNVPLKMTFKTFLREYHYEDWYLSTVTPRDMLHELTVGHSTDALCHQTSDNDGQHQERCNNNNINQS